MLQSLWNDFELYNLLQLKTILDILNIKNNHVSLTLKIFSFCNKITPRELFHKKKYFNVMSLWEKWYIFTLLKCHIHLGQSLNSRLVEPTLLSGLTLPIAFVAFCDFSKLNPSYLKWATRSLKNYALWKTSSKCVNFWT